MADTSITSDTKNWKNNIKVNEKSRNVSETKRKNLINLIR